METLYIFLQEMPNPILSYIPVLFILILIVFILIYVNKKDKKDLDFANNIDKTDQANKVANVTLTGGIIGLFTSSPQNTLNRRIKKENANGWRVIQVIPSASGNIFLFIFRLIILVITLFLYTPVDGYYIIMARDK
jgi:preprotein translocase subunit YajC